MENEIRQELILVEQRGICSKNLGCAANNYDNFETGNVNYFHSWQTFFVNVKMTCKSIDWTYCID